MSQKVTVEIELKGKALKFFTEDGTINSRIDAQKLEDAIFHGFATTLISEGISDLSHVEVSVHVCEN